jgi:hypothetical protein
VAVKQAWEVEVYTATKRGAGTDANIKMMVYGKNAAGENTEALCDFKSQTTDDMFEVGDIDPFSFELGDVGEPVKIRLEQDGAGRPPFSNLNSALFWLLLLSTLYFCFHFWFVSWVVFV